MRLIKKALSVENCGNYIKVVTDDMPVQIWFLTDEIIRIRLWLNFLIDVRSHFCFC